jgi:two-component sensor histidine kinase
LHQFRLITVEIEAIITRLDDFWTSMPDTSRTEALQRRRSQRNTSVDDPPSGDGVNDFPIVITAKPANARQHTIAFRGFAILVVIVAMVMFANIPLGRVDAFVPVIQTVMCVSDLLTATFLFAQYSVQPQRALLALASGFVFSGLFAFLQTLAFPDAYAPGVVIGNELGSSGWLFLFWHTTFPLAAIVYALTKDAGETAKPSDRSTRTAIGVTVACVVAATAGLTWGVTADTTYLPDFDKSLTVQASFARGAAAFCMLLSTAAIVLLFVRGRTILDQWLIVTLFAWLPNFIAASLHIVVRFTAGWYLGRVYALLAGSSLLFVLLAETLHLYTRLANAVVMVRRSEEHQRLLIAELDHRVKNTLAQVVGVATSTREGSASLDTFLLSLAGRIQSMAAAHTLLGRGGWRGVGLDALVRTELAPYATGTNVRISGADVMLTAAETQALAKVLHELATNAAKYGALSISGGQVSVTWDFKPVGQAATLILEWREAGGPPVAPEVQPSYGTDLIRDLIPHELGGTVDLTFATEGVHCKIGVRVKQS